MNIGRKFSKIKILLLGGGKLLLKVSAKVTGTRFKLFFAMLFSMPPKVSNLTVTHNLVGNVVGNGNVLDHRLFLFQFFIRFFGDFFPL